MATKPREQLCRLSYSDLEALARRLQEYTNDMRNPGIVWDMKQAARAASDLATFRFSVEEIATDCDDVKTSLALSALLGK